LRLKKRRCATGRIISSISPTGRSKALPLANVC
jgi:hypothetical protein